MAFSEALSDYFKAQENSACESVRKNTIGQIMKDHMPWILNNPEFSVRQRKTAGMIAACKTQSLGYYAEYCPKCDKVIGIHYRSCRNHCCPNCQTSSQIRWTMLREAEVIPGIPYFHVVLTLPHELNPLILANQKEMLSILFRAASESVIQLSLDPRFLGAVPGIISVIHTWTQELTPHFHIHMIISGGGLTEEGLFVGLKDGWVQRAAEADEPLHGEISSDEKDLIQALDEEDRDINQGSASENGDALQLTPVKLPHGDNVPFFLPERALTRLFRGKYLAYLSSLYHEHKLKFPGDLSYLVDPYEWSYFGSKVGSLKWIGHIVRTFQGNGNAIEYLARYTFRTAISNSRILSYNGRTVTISCRNNADYHNKRIVTMNVYEFIRRFLTHVPPKGFSRIRYSGILSNSQKKKNLNIIMEQISQTEYSPEKVKESVDRSIAESLHKLGFLSSCPCCGTKLEIIAVHVRFGRRRRSASPAA